MPIKLPALLRALNYQDCLAIAKEIIQNPAEIIEVDAGNLYRVDPFGLSLLASTGSQLALRNKKLRIINLRPELMTGAL